MNYKAVLAVLPLIVLALLAFPVIPASPPSLARVATAQSAGDVHWDDRFGAVGIFNGVITALVADTTGNLYAGGFFPDDIPGLPAKNIARWDGRRWHALGAGIPGVVSIRRIAAHTTTIYVVGEFAQAGAANVNGIARWDGQRWSAVGSGIGAQQQIGSGFIAGTVNAVAVAPNGNLYVGGLFTHIDGVPARSVARWDGTRWHALGAGITLRLGESDLDAPVYALAVDEAGALYAGGSFNQAGNTAALSIARWDGQRWTALGAGLGSGVTAAPEGDVRTLLVSGDRLYAGGRFAQAGGAPATNIAAWDGQRWAALGAGLAAADDQDVPVRTLLAQGAMLYAGGDFTTAGGRAVAGLAGWNGAAWSAVGPQLEASAALSVTGLAPAPGGGIYAAGNFTAAGGRALFGVGRWNGTTWEQLGQGLAAADVIPATAQAMAVAPNGDIYVGGVIGSAGGLPVRNLARWDGERWHDVGGGVGGAPDAYVTALVLVGDILYVGGSFNQAGSIAVSNIAAWNTVAGTWSALGGGMDGIVFALAAGDGIVYAGGSFDRAGQTDARDVAAWDDGRWSALGGDWEIYEVLDSGAEAGTFVQALAYHNGEIFIGGNFATIHERGKSFQDPASYVWVNNLVSYRPAEAEWYAQGPEEHFGVTTDGGNGPGTDVLALAVVGNALFVGGAFNQAGGIPALNLARYDIAADRWTAPGAPGGLDRLRVSALAAVGGALLVGGSFTTIDATPADFIAGYNTVEQRWSALGSGMTGRFPDSGEVRSFAVAADAIYAGGTFITAGPHPSLSFARYTGPIDGANSVDPAQRWKVFLPTLRR